MSGVPVSWTDREPPLIPHAAAAVGEVARRLAQRLLEFEPTMLRRLAGVAGQTSLIVMGEETILPWVDGVVYLGRDPLAPSLLLPTRIRPLVPAANVLEKAILNRFPKVSPPIAVLPDRQTLISCHQALPILRNRLEEWLRGGSA